MRPFIVLARVIIVGCFWSVFFFEGIRVIMLRNWRFDIVNKEHWDFAWTLWINGWIISDAKEWAFIIIIITFTPLWITGWASLSLINIEDIILKIFKYPTNFIVNLFSIHFPNLIKGTDPVNRVKKRRSYKEIRPQGIGVAKTKSSFIAMGANKTPAYTPTSSSTTSSYKSSPLSKPKKEEIKSSIFEHSIFDDKGDNDTENFNFDIFDIDVNKKEKTNTVAKEPAIKKPLKKYIPKQPNQNHMDDDISAFMEEDIPTKREKTKNNDKFDGNKNPQRKERTKSFDDFEENIKPKNSRDERKSSQTKVSKEDISNNRNAKNIENNRDIKTERNNRIEKENKAKASPVNEVIKDQDSQSKREPKGGVPDIVKDKGYRIFTSTLIKDNLIDFIGVSKEYISLFLIDREHGDWLADEEDFNGEDPLWFSENSHRVSPVRQLEYAKKYLLKELSKNDYTQDVKAFLIIQLGNIINADEMFDIWKKKDITVTRIDRGTPKDIILFEKALKDVEAISYNDFSKIRNFIRELK